MEECIQAEPYVDLSEVELTKKLSGIFSITGMSLDIDLFTACKSYFYYLRTNIARKTGMRKWK